MINLKDLKIDFFSKISIECAGGYRLLVEISEGNTSQIKKEVGLVEFHEFLLNLDMVVLKNIELENKK